MTVAPSDLEASRRFYEIVLATLSGDPWDCFALGAGSPTRRIMLVPGRTSTDNAGMELAPREML